MCGLGGKGYLAGRAIRPRERGENWKGGGRGLLFKGARGDQKAGKGGFIRVVLEASSTSVVQYYTDTPLLLRCGQVLTPNGCFGQRAPLSWALGTSLRAFTPWSTTRPFVPVPLPAAFASLARGYLFNDKKQEQRENHRYGKRH